jgi:exosortase
MSSPQAVEPVAAQARQGFARAPTLHVLWLAAFLVVAAPSVLWLVERWTRGIGAIWYSGQHGIFIPFLAGFFAWRELRQTREPEAGSAWGWLFVLPGLACMVLDVVAGTGLLGAIGMVLSLPGLALLALGRGWTRRLAFPLALGWLMLPIPAVLASQAHVVLRLISASATSYLLPLFGVAVARQGTTLLIPRGEIEVSDACSGFSTLHASVTLALILAYLTPSLGRRALLLGVAPLLALATNVVRVTALVLLCHFYGFELLDTVAHQLSGYAAFAVSLVVLFALAGPTALGGRAR